MEQIEIIRIEKISILNWNKRKIANTFLLQKKGILRKTVIIQDKFRLQMDKTKYKENYAKKQYRFNDLNLIICYWTFEKKILIKFSHKINS